MNQNHDALATSSTESHQDQENLTKKIQSLTKICDLAEQFFSPEAFPDNSVETLRTLLPKSNHLKADLLVFKDQEADTIPSLLSIIFETCLAKVRKLFGVLPVSLENIQTTFNPADLSASEENFTSLLNEWEIERLKQTGATLLLQVIQNSTQDYLGYHGDKGRGCKHGKRGVEKVTVLQQRVQAKMADQVSSFIARLALLVDFYNDRLKNENDDVMPGGTSNPHNHSYISFLANALKASPLRMDILSSSTQQSVALKKDEDYTSQDRSKHVELKQTRRMLSQFFKHLNISEIETRLDLQR